MLQIILTGVLFIISLSVLFFTNTGITWCIIIPILYLIICASSYTIGYKQGIIDTKNGIHYMVEKELEAHEAELKRLSEGVDSGLL